MKVGDIEVPIDRATGDPLLSEGLPRYIFVHIRRSKTDQAALGMGDQFCWFVNDLLSFVLGSRLLEI